MSYQQGQKVEIRLNEQTKIDGTICGPSVQINTENKPTECYPVLLDKPFYNPEGTVHVSVLLVEVSNLPA